MTNSLTGDFDAVLELGGGTLNRLVATMHQNGDSDGSKPGLPHIAHFRLGDDMTAPGVRGSVAVQIGVPHVELIHGASDRFRLHVDIRARYRADPGSTPLADIIHGTVHAEYRFEDIDPTCFGWQGIANDYLWMRVIKDTVSFDGILRNESSMLSFIGVMNEQVVKGQVNKVLATLLDTHFAPTPQPVDGKFRQLRSLALGGGPTRSGIAMPFGLSGETPAGNLATVNDLFIGERDFGVAVSRDCIITAIEPKLAPLTAVQRDFHVHGDAGIGGGLEIDYHIRVDAATAEWVGPLTIALIPVTGGLIRIRLSGVGWASRMYRSGVFNIGSVSASDLGMSFNAEQFLLLDFEAGTEQLTVTAFGAPIAAFNYGGPFSSYVKPMATDAINSAVQSRITSALIQAKNELAFFTAPARKTALIKQLRRIDGSATARFTDAVFRAEGLILRGVIPLNHRHVPQVAFEKTTTEDGFDAIESWIPGGRVDSFEWTWRWYTNGIEAPPGAPGSLAEDDTFTLRRPPGKRSRFGVSMNLVQPLPGLDGHGRVCLVINGMQVDHVTGALVPVTSIKECAQFSYEFRLPYEVGPYIRICDPLRGVGVTPEIGIMRIGEPETKMTASNTLLLRLGDGWDEEAVAALREGVEHCRREGAGLLTVVLFDEGALSRAQELRERLQDLRESLAAPLMVSEDLRGGWRNVLALPPRAGELAWRLMTPQGTIAWSHEGRADGELIASILDERLVPSAPAVFGRIRPGVEIGSHLPIELVTRHCPPLPLSRFGVSEAHLVFIHKDSGSTMTHIARQARERPDSIEPAPLTAIVVEGANSEEVEALRSRWKLDVPIFPDWDGTLTRRAGVRFSPSILTLDDQGRLAGCQLGIEVEDQGAKDMQHGSEPEEAS